MGETMIRKSLEALCAALLGGLIAVPFVQIVMRYVFHSPIVGAEELTRFLLICTVFLSYPLVVESGENIVMGEIREALPHKLRRALTMLATIAGAAVCAFLAIVALTNITANMNNATPTLKIPFWLFLGSAFLGFAGAAGFHILHIRRSPQDRSSVSL